MKHWIVVFICHGSINVRKDATDNVPFCFVNMSEISNIENGIEGIKELLSDKNEDLRPALLGIIDTVYENLLELSRDVKKQFQYKEVVVNTNYCLRCYCKDNIMKHSDLSCEVLKPELQRKFNSFFQKFQILYAPEN